jgi:hypothetical protein
MDMAQAFREGGILRLALKGGGRNQPAAEPGTASRGNWTERSSKPSDVDARAVVQAAGEAFAPALQAENASVPETAICRHEFTRLKTPWSAG